MRVRTQNAACPSCSAGSPAASSMLLGMVHSAHCGFLPEIDPCTSAQGLATCGDTHFPELRTFGLLGTGLIPFPPSGLFQRRSHLISHSVSLGSVPLSVFPSLVLTVFKSMR